MRNDKQPTKGDTMADDPDSLIHQGNALVERGSHAEALALYERALGADPSSAFGWLPKSKAFSRSVARKTTSC